MPTIKLTEAVIAKLDLPPGKDDIVFWDEDLPGFGVRPRRNKRTGEVLKFYRIQYRSHGQQGGESLGDVRKVKLDAARKIARQRFAQIELGINPTAERAAAKEAVKIAADVISLGSIADRYLADRKPNVAAGSFRDMSRFFAVGSAPLRKRPANAVTRAEIAARLQDIVVESGPVAAARARSYLSAAYAWAMREGLVDANPVIGTNKPDKDIASRDRILSDAELRIVWNAANAGDDYSKIVRLLILLGNRRQEIGSLKWSDVGDDGTITISDTKGGNPLVLTLPDKALDILNSVERRDGNDFVFGGRASGFTNWSNARSIFGANITETMAEWTLHDLRRTFRTGLSKIGVEPHIAERLIGHSVGSKVTKTYDRFAYRKEMHDALLKWEEHVAAIVESRKGKIVKLKTA